MILFQEVSMYQEIQEAKTIVIKMGTTCLTHQNGKLNLRKMDQLAQILTDMQNQGKRVVLVSSGAIGCGMNRLGIKNRLITLEEKQAVASVGQGLLMEIYQRFFSIYHQSIGQILLTKDVFSNEIKRRNAKNTFQVLLEMGSIPIVNENDSISTDEIQEECFGDNDILSAMTAHLVDADLLIILSDVDGLYDKNPNNNEDAKRIPIVEKVDADIMRLGGKSISGLGTGGMITKVGAAKYATERGISTIIASGEDVSVLYEVFEKEVGTIFLKQEGA